MFTPELIVHENVVPELIPGKGFSLRQDVLARNWKGEVSARIRKKTSRLIEKLNVPLTKFLEPGEQLVYLARVQRHASGLIQYTMGWYIYYASATVIVFTNRRLLHLRVKNNNQWDSGIRTCAWADVESAEVKGWLTRVLKLKFRNGAKYQYWRISRADALNIKKLLPPLLRAHEGISGQSNAGSRALPLVSLCPECKHELAAATQRCPGCGLTFKMKRTMYWLSLVPSAAYIYTRKLLLAFFDLIAQSYGYLLLAVAIYIFVAAFSGWKDTDGKTVQMADGIGVLAVGVFIFGLDVIITIHHNNYFIDDFIPSGRKVQPTESAKGFAPGASIG